MTSSANSRRVCPSVHRWSSGWPTAWCETNPTPRTWRRRRSCAPTAACAASGIARSSSAWLVRLTWRLALDWRRAERRRGAREDAIARVTRQFGNAEDDAAEQQRQTRLWAAIETLPEKLRLVLVLSAIEGHTVRDVAELVGSAGWHGQVPVVRSTPTTAGAAPMMTERDVLREIESALDVSPSRGFEARVREQVRKQSMHGPRWTLPAAVAVAATVVLAVMLVPHRQTPASRVLVRPDTQPAPAAVETIKAPERTRPVTEARAAAPRRPRRSDTPVTVRLESPEVVVPAGQTAGIRRARRRRLQQVESRSACHGPNPRR